MYKRQIIDDDEIIVKGGTYKLDIPEGQVLYGKTATIRPFMQRYMYKRFVKNMSAKKGEPMGTYHKTVMADSLNKDLKDNQGGFNCGKPAGYIQDFKALPEKTQELIRQIKRVRVILGTVKLVGATDAKGNAVNIKDTAFIWEIDNRDAFKTLGNTFSKLAKMQRLPVQHLVMLSTGEQKLPNGNSFYLPVASLDVSNVIDITDADQEMFGDFMIWIDNYNSYIVNEWAKKANENMDDEDIDVVDDIVDIDIEDEVA